MSIMIELVLKWNPELFLYLLFILLPWLFCDFKFYKFYIVNKKNVLKQ